MKRTRIDLDESNILEPYYYGSAIQSNQIRHLKLRSGLPGSKIEFELHTFDRSGCEYYALSYAWLDPLCDQEVIRSGKSLNITSSLKAALLRLRESYAECNFWIDAVCINQNDDVDKSFKCDECQIFITTRNQ